MNRLITQKTVDKAGNIIAQYIYTLGAGGERVRVEEEGPSGSIVTDYDYDASGRLAEERITADGESLIYSYAYDSVGNRTEKKENGNKTTYTYNARNQLISETTDGNTITYAYDANGNLLHADGSGTGTVYTYDNQNRLLSCSRNGGTESYTYDAEGIRRSKTTGDTAVTEAGAKTIYFISDTTGELSQTLAETDEEGTLLASYTRGDTLVSQSRNGVTSIFLYDGHGDVRGLLDDDGTVTDTYRYNAYGELLNKTGTTENHYLYTGEYYDEASSLYYLRARYMNPSTGTFISMDSYEGNIYDPDTLHKYLYANGNPVKYTDPSGKFFVDMTISTTITMGMYTLMMGFLTGAISATIADFLGEDQETISSEFIKGLVFGLGFGTVLLFAMLHCTVMVVAAILEATATTNVIINGFMLDLALYNEDDVRRDQKIIVYGTLLIVSLISFMQVNRFYGELDLYGNGGSAKAKISEQGVEDIEVNKGGIKTNFDNEIPRSGDEWHNYFNEKYGSDNVIWESASIDDIIDMPSNIVDFSPSQVADLARNSGWSVEPLGKGGLAGVPFEQGGGLSMHAPNGSSLYIQYHPGGGHHGSMPYFKVSSGQNGTVRYYINGERAN